MRLRHRCFVMFAVLSLSTSGCWFQRGSQPPVLPANVDDLGAKPSARAGSVAEVTDPHQIQPEDNLPELPPTPEDEEITKLMAEIAKVGNIDAAAQQRLLADLKKTPRDQWPMLVNVFRASLEYQTERKTPKPKETVFARPPAKPPVAKSATVKSTDKSANPLRSPEVEEVAKEPAKPVTPPEKQDTLTLSPRNVLREGGAGGAVVVSPERPNPIRGGDYPSAEPPSVAPPERPQDQPVQLATAEDDIIPPIVPNKLPAAPVYAKPTSWRQSLDDTIALLQDDPADRDPATQAKLRLLYLAADRRDEAASEIPGLSDDAKGYWSEQLYTLGLYLDDEQVPNDRQRATRAAHHARTAAHRLGQMGNLIVRNIAMTNAVHSYGVYDELSEYRLAPGQEIIVYAELENFTSVETAKGYHTSLKASYEILDRRGKSIATETLGSSEEYCRNLRRDFFVAYSVIIPRDLYNGGEYTLRLTVEDVKSNRTGESVTKFRVQK